MALGLLAFILVTQCNSFADPLRIRYRVTQNGATITPRISFAADRMRTIPRPPNKKCGKAAGTITGAVQIPIDDIETSQIACCYSLVKGFWQYAGSTDLSPFVDPVDPVVLPVLILNDDSVVKVESATGSKLSDVPVRVVNPGTQQMLQDPELSPDIDAAWLPEGHEQYPRSYDVMFNDHSSYTVKDDMKTDSLGSYHFTIPASYPIQVKYAAKYKGFWHYSPENITSFPANETLRMPVDSSLTINYLGERPAGIPVEISTPDNDSDYINSEHYVTNTDGIVSYAIPTGTQFRFIYHDDTGEKKHTQVLVAPVSGSIIVPATNNPSLITPANNVSVPAGQFISLDWGNTLNAAKYYWIYRYNGGSWNYMDRGTSTILNLSGLPSAGTWEWQVWALDINGNKIASSEIRTVNVTAAVKSASTKRSLASASACKEAGEVIDFNNKVEDLNLSSGVIIVDEGKK